MKINKKLLLSFLWLPAVMLGVVFFASNNVHAEEKIPLCKNLSYQALSLPYIKCKEDDETFRMMDPTPESCEAIGGYLIDRTSTVTTTTYTSTTGNKTCVSAAKIAEEDKKCNVREKDNDGSKFIASTVLFDSKGNPLCVRYGGSNNANMSCNGATQGISEPLPNGGSKFNPFPTDNDSTIKELRKVERGGCLQYASQNRAICEQSGGKFIQKGGSYIYTPGGRLLSGLLFTVPSWIAKNTALSAFDDDECASGIKDDGKEACEKSGGSWDGNKKTCSCPNGKKLNGKNHSCEDENNPPNKEGGGGSGGGESGGGGSGGGGSGGGGSVAPPAAPPLAPKISKITNLIRNFDPCLAQNPSEHSDNTTGMALGKIPIGGMDVSVEVFGGWNKDNTWRPVNNLVGQGVDKDYLAKFPDYKENSKPQIYSDGKFFEKFSKEYPKDEKEAAIAATAKKTAETEKKTSTSTPAPTIPRTTSLADPGSFSSAVSPVNTPTPTPTNPSIPKTNPTTTPAPANLRKTEPVYVRENDRIVFLEGVETNKDGKSEAILGGLPVDAKIKIVYNGRAIIVKNGGDKRQTASKEVTSGDKKSKASLSLWWEVARMLDIKDENAVVHIEAVNEKAESTSYWNGPLSLTSTLPTAQKGATSTKRAYIIGDSLVGSTHQVPPENTLDSYLKTELSNSLKSQGFTDVSVDAVPGVPIKYIKPTEPTEKPKTQNENSPDLKLDDKKNKEATATKTDTQKTDLKEHKTIDVYHYLNNSSGTIKQASDIIVALGNDNTTNFDETSLKELVSAVREINRNANLSFIAPILNEKSTDDKKKIAELVKSKSLEYGYKVIEYAPQTEDPTNKENPRKKFVDTISQSIIKDRKDVVIQSYCCGSSQQDGELKGRDNLEKIYNYFLNKDLTDFQAAAIVGNISQESGGNPTIIEGEEKNHTTDPSSVAKGWGIIQWTPGSKVLDVVKKANITGQIYDLKTQLDIVWWHMNNEAPTGTKNFITGFKSTKNIEEAVKDFEKRMKAPLASAANTTGRIQSARLVSESYTQNTILSSIPTDLSASTGCACNSASIGKEILLDPGHSGKKGNPNDTDPITGLYNHDTDNGKETTDMFEVATKIKAILEKKGYKVKMTKEKASDYVNLSDRARMATPSSTALAVSLHSTGGSFGSNISWVTPQKVGQKRTNPSNGKSVEFKNELTAKKSQEYAQKILEARKKHEPGVNIHDLNFDTRGLGYNKGNIPVVQLLSPDVPWIYNEAGQSGINLDKYAEGVAEGIMNAVKPDSASSTSLSGDSCGAVTGNIVQTAINYAWAERNHKPATDRKPTYVESINKAKKENKYIGGHEGVDCGGFVTRVIQDSRADLDYGGKGNTVSQLSYVKSKPDKYLKITPKSTADLAPGDIAINGGHTFLYIGENPGFPSSVASASFGERAPNAGGEKAPDSSYEWFRLIR